MENMTFKKFVMTTMNGMVYGLFATLIIGVIIGQIGTLLNATLISVTLSNALKGLMGVGIGIGIALSLKMDGLKMVVASISGGIAASFSFVFGEGIIPSADALAVLYKVYFNNPITIYFVVVLTIMFLKYVWVKKTPVDIVLVPILGSFVALVLTLVLSGPLGWALTQISVGIDQATLFAPLPMSMILAVVMGMLLTSPLSSAAIAIAINLDGLAGAAAVVGCSVQMIGFAVQSRKDNNIGMVFSIAIGTSMLQFKNILKKPMIWLPTIITSAILAPIIVLPLDAETTAYGAGMGTSALVGQLQTLDAMDYSLKAWLMIIFILVGGSVLVYFIDLIFRKYHLINDGDLAVNNDI
ncbi:PTS sugar transporter subunit IIC [Mycoplasmatota bacterium]|nr:PTS sugar transporter subunit IIC [Mycoplasmatota bacterium]